MATPEITAVINAAKQYEADELKLEQLKLEKTEHQGAIADLNTQITQMVTVVQASKSALKAAANNI